MSAGPNVDASPARLIVVSGLPRSGTSMLMAMLEAGGIPLLTDGRRAADPDNPRGYFEYEPVKRLPAGDHSWLFRSAGRAVKIVVPLVRALPADLPCDVLLLERNLDQILASQAAMLARLARPAAPQHLLRPAFEREWTRTKLQLEARAAGRLLVVAHSRVLDNPTAAVEEIAGFLARPLDPAAMIAVVEPALFRQKV
jgi:hypothetical protein